MSHGFSGRPAASDVIAFGNLLAGPADGRGAVGTAFAAGLAADFAAGAVLRVAGLAAVPTVVFAAGFALAFAVAAGLASAAFDLTAFDVASAFAFAALVVFAGFATCRSLNRSYCFGMLARHHRPDQQRYPNACRNARNPGKSGTLPIYLCIATSGGHASLRHRECGKTCRQTSRPRPVFGRGSLEPKGSIPTIGGIADQQKIEVANNVVICGFGSFFSTICRVPEFFSASRGLGKQAVPKLEKRCLYAAFASLIEGLGRTSGSAQ
ncbi:hypothetical protein NKJ72_04645 [Mesorhizobium sp. M0045]|uniref:hypothetical protein n=1 Tax=unclassified Mesorhizobium TaxID=325217 RepID=UPI00333DA96D